MTSRSVRLVLGRLLPFGVVILIALLATLGVRSQAPAASPSTSEGLAPQPSARTEKAPEAPANASPDEFTFLPVVQRNPLPTATPRPTATPSPTATTGATPTATPDQGDTFSWTCSSTGSDGSLSGLYFVDDLYGWVAGYPGIIRHTTDGGITWQQQYNAGTGNIYGVHFLDRSRGWAVGGGSLILRTTDGGSRWQPQASPISTDTFLEDIQFVDATHGWITGGHVVVYGSSLYYQGYFLRTTDGGATWQSAASFDTMTPIRMSFIDSNHGWLIMSGRNNSARVFTGRIMATSDGGVNWTTQFDCSNCQMNDIDMVGSSGWVAMKNGRLLHTDNGGANWSYQVGDQSSSGQDLSSVDFVDVNRGWVAWGSGIKYTLNGGSTWTDGTYDSTCSTFGRLFFFDAQHGWSLTRDTSVWRYR